MDEQRAIWESRLDRLDAFVMSVMEECDNDTKSKAK
jgi:hypothetical protein